MWKTLSLVLLLVAVPCLADVRTDLLRTVREATTSKARVAAARKLEDSLPDGADRWTYLRPLVETLEQRGEVDAAVGALERSAGKVGERLEFQRRLRLSGVLLRAGRLDAAQAAAEAALEAAEEEPQPMVRAGNVADVNLRLGEIHERAGRFAEALRCYRKWEWTASCGTGMDWFVARRDLAVARCRFEVGDVDEALDAMLVLVGNEGTGSDAAVGIPAGSADAAVAFGEYSARAGRSAAARKLVSGRKGAGAADLRRLVDLGIAVHARDAERVLELAGAGFEGKSVPEAGAHARTAVAAAALARLRTWGDGAAEAALPRIVDGDRVATLIAMDLRLPGVEGALRRRLERETEKSWREFLTSWLEFEDGPDAR